MKINYKGFEIECTRERALGGWMSLYYGIYRQSDGYAVDEGSCDVSDVSVRDYIQEDLKPIVDQFLKDPWDKKEVEEDKKYEKDVKPIKSSSENKDEILKEARTLINDLCDLISVVCPDSSVWEEDGGLAERADKFEQTYLELVK